MMLLAAIVFGCYTNHAGFAACGAPVALDRREVVLSNAEETVKLPLSAFPELERRRIAADYVLGHPESGVGALMAPQAVKDAVLASDRADRRSRLRAEKGFCTKEESDAFRRKSAEALSSWLDSEVSAGRILPSERKAIDGAR
ncbi:MAG: hypothetical protein K6G91_08835 [Kiritimatiellae bacterium]|nr:hypothetical protein [Kiritimatiellia bacterium]